MQDAIQGPLFMLTLEVGAVVFNLIFLLYIIMEKKVGWIYGIIAALISAYFFYLNNYLSESLLYVFYAVMGVFGFAMWSRPQKAPITTLSAKVHIGLLFLGTMASLGLGYLMQGFGADRSYVDASSTCFAIIATFLEIYKKLGAWIYWILLNGFSIWLYADKGAWIYASLMLIYVGMSIAGFISWKKKWESRLPAEG